MHGGLRQHVATDVVGVVIRERARSPGVAAARERFAHHVGLAAGVVHQGDGPSVVDDLGLDRLVTLEGVLHAQIDLVLPCVAAFVLDRLLRKLGLAVMRCRARGQARAQNQAKRTGQMVFLHEESFQKPWAESHAPTAHSWFFIAPGRATPVRTGVKSARTTSRPFSVLRAANPHVRWRQLWSEFGCGGIGTKKSFRTTRSAITLKQLALPPQNPREFSLSPMFQLGPNRAMSHAPDVNLFASMHFAVSRLAG